MLPSKGYAAQSATTPLSPFAFERRDPGPADVQIDILFCGVCHSDLHTARSEWPGTRYPCVPGHEIVGRVARVGGQVSKFKVGRPRRRRLPGRQLPQVRVVRRGAGAVLRERLHRHVQRPGARHGQQHVRRLLEPHRRRREVRAEDPPSGSAARRGGAAAVRRHHHLVAACAVGSRSRPDGRRRRPRRPRPHGRQARPRARRATSCCSRRRRARRPTRSCSARTRS